MNISVNTFEGSSPHTRGAQRRRRLSHRPRRIIPAYAGSTTPPTPESSPTTDHPRIRGEHGSTAKMSGLRVGSSPHTRGAQHSQDAPVDVERIIPAYAGSTSCRRARVGGTRDHPRIRGEHRLSRRCFRHRWGSSPHTRGAPFQVCRCWLGWRIIPAYAGSTSHLLVHEAGSGDHPRIRGEHALALLLWRGEAGSSPHTRGARGRLSVGTPDSRIIPAYAGSTAAELGAQVGAEDHPRIRGEHGASYMFVYTNMRIIPAYAGSTGAPVGRSGSVGDHPRIRGEHQLTAIVFSCGSPSSPHTRGAPGRRGRGETGVGIIPAYAGSTPRRIRTFPHIWDHPRIRGEHFHTAVEQGARDGSSPHTRGAPAGA